MALESKPLFHPEVIRQRVRAFTLPGSVRECLPTLQRWAHLIASGRADNLTETELLPAFLTDIFCGLLGYTGPAGPARTFTLCRQRHLGLGGEIADAVLGRFGQDQEQFVAVLQGKDLRDPLDRPFAGRRLSAVNQAYRYARKLPCDWLLVTSIRETRLYHKGAHPRAYERFETLRLAADEASLKRFVFLLGAERVLPPYRESHLYDLLRASEWIGHKLTSQFYALCADIRQKALTRLCRQNPAVAPQQILRSTQKLLERLLFCAFCEGHALLPPNSLRRAFEQRDPAHPEPLWYNFRRLFHALHQGKASQLIPAPITGPFAPDPLLDSLQVPDEVCALFKDLRQYDYRPARDVADADELTEVRSLIDAQILGHTFAQSITDLERLRQGLVLGAGPADAGPATSRPKPEAAFDAPASSTRYIVQQTLGSLLKQRFESLRQQHESEAPSVTRKALAAPETCDPSPLKEFQRKALIDFWQAWQEQLFRLRILDPACGSAAFLLEAFDQLHASYELSNARLEELRGQRPPFDLGRQILQNNLYAVGLNQEAVDSCQLSLWLKTAVPGQPLTSLEHTICHGHSLVSDAAVHPKAFHWPAAFPEVFAQGGFDVVVGHPPSLPQELLAPLKPWLQTHYETFHDMAGLQVYFYELGLRVLKPGGLLAFLGTNQWMNAACGQPLRRFFSQQAWVQSVVDFSYPHSDQAALFPSIIVLEKPTNLPKPKTARLCSIPHEARRIEDLSLQLEQTGLELELARLSPKGWQLETLPAVHLLHKLRGAGKPLAELARVAVRRGVDTALHPLFLVDEDCKRKLIAQHQECEVLFYPCWQSGDLSRWTSDRPQLWLLALASSHNRAWPWADLGERAEADFQSRYPSLYGHLKPWEELLRHREHKGKYWWELRFYSHWAEFERPKIIHPLVACRMDWCLDHAGTLCHSGAWFLPTDDLWVLAAANAPVTWWFAWRRAMRAKDGGLRFPKAFIQDLPIPSPTAEQSQRAQLYVRRLLEITARQHQTRHGLRDWLRVEFQIEPPRHQLFSLTELEAGPWVRKVKSLRGKHPPLTPAALRALHDAYTRTIEPARALAAEALRLECAVSDVVNQAYGLTPADIELMRKTAPPRLPVPPSAI